MRDETFETSWRFHMAAERPVVSAAILGFSGFFVHFVHASWSDPVLTATAVGLFAASLWKWFLPVTITAAASGYSKTTVTGTSRVEWSGVDGVRSDGDTLVVMVRTEVPAGRGASILRSGRRGGFFEILVPPSKAQRDAFVNFARQGGVKVADIAETSPTAAAVPDSAAGNSVAGNSVDPAAGSGPGVADHGAVS